MSDECTVAIAVIVREGQLLLVRRHVMEGSPRWRFPATTMEPGETAEEAAVREACEEAGVQSAARGVVCGRINPRTGRRVLYVACDPAHRATREEDAACGTQAAWFTSSGLPGNMLDSIFPSMQHYLEEILRP